MSYLFERSRRSSRSKSRGRKRSVSRKRSMSKRSKRSKRGKRTRSTSRKRRSYSPWTGYDYDYGSYLPGGVYSRVPRYYSILDDLGYEMRRIRANTPLQALMRFKNRWEPNSQVRLRQISTGPGHDSVFLFRIPAESIWDRGEQVIMPVLETVKTYADLFGNLKWQNGEYLDPFKESKRKQLEDQISKLKQSGVLETTGYSSKF